MNSTQKTNNFLLLGGNGFLGKGLQNELSNRKLNFRSIDIDECDFSNSDCIDFLIPEICSSTHIVLLASKIGVKLFRTNPIESAEENKQIFNNVIGAVIKANTPIQFSYYSTCEIFGSSKSIDEFITLETKPNFVHSLRRLYAKTKYEAELQIQELSKSYPNIIQEWKIFRPFNVSGKNQRRGVVFEMVKSAICDQEIHFSDQTTRTFTPIDVASRMAVDAMLQHGNKIYHLVDEQNSTFMQTLATNIAEILTENNIVSNIKLIRDDPDFELQYRNVGFPNANVASMKTKLKTIVLGIVNDLER